LIIPAPGKNVNFARARFHLFRMNVKKSKYMDERRRKLAAAELRFIRAQLDQLEMLLQAISSKTLALMAIYRSQRKKKARFPGKPANRTIKASPKKRVSAPGAAPEGRVRAAGQTEGVPAQPPQHDRLQEPPGMISTPASLDVVAPPDVWVGPHDLGEPGLGEPDVDRPQASPAD
jgi:hypothetical protein